MRPMLSLMLALAAAGCAAQPHGFEHGPPGRRLDGHGGGGRLGFGRERGLLFISPVGEPFRSGPGASDPERAWFDGADTDHNGKLTRAEFTADALRFFAVLDRGHDGEIDPDDIDFYENTLVPEVRSGGGGGDGGMKRSGGGRQGGGRRGGGQMGGGGMGGGGMGGGGGGRSHGGGGQNDGSPDGGAPRTAVDTGKQGAARFSYFDYPEPITVMDRNFNRGIDRDEMTAAAADRFHVLDRNGDGVIERGELPHAAARATGMGPGSGGRGPRPARREDEAEPDTE